MWSKEQQYVGQGTIIVDQGTQYVHLEHFYCFVTGPETPHRTTRSLSSSDEAIHDRTNSYEILKCIH